MAAKRRPARLYTSAAPSRRRVGVQKMYTYILLFTHSYTSTVRPIMDVPIVIYIAFVGA